MDVKDYIILISAIINLLIGLLVYVKGRKKTVNIVYGLFALSVASWSIGMIFYRTAETINSSIFWCKALYAAPIFIVVFLVYFTFIFPTYQISKKEKLVIFSIGGLILFFTLFTNLVINNVIIALGQEKEIVFGRLYTFYVLFISGFFTWSYLNLLKKIIKSQGLVRAQLLYVFLGTFISSIISLFTNLLLPTFHVFTFNWVGQITGLLMASFIAYAIIVHRIMDIQVALRAGSVYLAILISLILPAIFIKYLINLYYPEIILWADFLIIIVAITIFSPLRNYYYRIANKYFFTSLYDARKVITELSDKLSSTLRLKSIYKYITSTIIKSLHSRSIVVIIYNEKEKKYKVQYSVGKRAIKNINLQGEKRLHLSFIKHNKPIILEELKKKSYIRYRRTLDFLLGNGIEILVPLNIKNKTIGAIALGSKESKDLYSDEDLQVLEVVGTQSAIAIKNALQFEEINHFNIKLNREIENATADLRAANNELKQLDQAKSEFVSIASHQLRTPLTVIKGYISMILENNFGQVVKRQKEPLEKVFESNERLILLVENLLNISRIESGRIKFNYEELDLKIIVMSVFDELKESAKNKELEFTYKEPKRELPEIKVDREKIRQVVMNLMDNSIKYTQKGNVAVEIRQTENNIEFCVSDTGTGIKSSDLPNLFKKFSRGTGTSLIHTEGTGLGLYVAKQMVKFHGGHIWAESKGLNKGSKFCFTLPIRNSKLN